MLLCGFRVGLLKPFKPQRESLTVFLKAAFSHVFLYCSTFQFAPLHHDINEYSNTSESVKATMPLMARGK